MKARMTDFFKNIFSRLFDGTSDQRTRTTNTTNNPSSRMVKIAPGKGPLLPTEEESMAAIDATAKPVKPEVDWNFIGQLEGFETRGYVPTGNDGKVLDRSGVTVATGFDIGQWSKEDIQKLGLNEELEAKLLPYAGLRKNAAVVALQQLPLEVSIAEAEEINSAVKADAITKLAQDWQKATGQSFSSLDPAKQTVVASLAFQYGSLPKRTPKFWEHVTNDKWGKAIAELRDFGDKYDTRRNKEADYLTIALK